MNAAPPPLQLVLRWTGEAASFDKGELHLASTGEALVALAVAFRRCYASDSPRLAGRLPDVAREVDLKLVEVRSGSTMPVFEPVYLGDGTLFPDALLDAVKTGLSRLLDHFQRGPVEGSVLTKYFEALPPGLTSDSLLLICDGNVEREAVRSVTSAPVQGVPMRRSYRGRARLLAVDLAKKALTLDLADLDHGQDVRVTLKATDEQLDRAWTDRREFLEIMAVMPDGPDRTGRCVWLGSPIASRARLTPDEVLKSIHTTWRSVYEVLAS